MSKVAVVTGGSSGIGLYTAKSLSKCDCKVYEISRRQVHVPGIVHLSVDVTDAERLSAAINSVYEREGRLDILVCNAGMGISGAVEFTELTDAKYLFDVNFFGMINAVKAAIPLMRMSGGGRIVCLSSVAGVLPIPFQTYYTVSKSAVNSFAMALQNEVRDFGITVCAVMPGDIKTGFTEARRKTSAGDDIYKGKIERSVSTMEKDEQNGMSPEIAGNFICKVALKNRVKPLYTIGVKYKLFVFLMRILPYRFINFVLGQLYAK